MVGVFGNGNLTRASSHLLSANMALISTNRIRSSGGAYSMCSWCSFCGVTLHYFLKGVKLRDGGKGM